MQEINYEVEMIHINQSSFCIKTLIIAALKSTKALYSIKKKHSSVSREPEKKT